jgi:hypothetical protein
MSIEQIFQKCLYTCDRLESQRLKREKVHLLLYLRRTKLRDWSRMHACSKNSREKQTNPSKVRRMSNASRLKEAIGHHCSQDRKRKPIKKRPPAVRSACKVSCWTCLLPLSFFPKPKRHRYAHLSRPSRLRPCARMIKRRPHPFFMCTCRAMQNVLRSFNALNPFSVVATILTPRSEEREKSTQWIRKKWYLRFLVRPEDGCRATLDWFAHMYSVRSVSTGGVCVRPFFRRAKPAAAALAISGSLACFEAACSRSFLAAFWACFLKSFLSRDETRGPG